MIFLWILIKVCLLIYIVKHLNAEIESNVLFNTRIVLQINQTTVNSTFTKDGHTKIIELTIFLSSDKFILDLHINNQLFASNYTEKLINENNITVRKVNHTQHHCYYIGKVRGFKNSLAAISTCSKINGFFSINDTSYQISSTEDEASSLRFSRGSYRVRRVLNDSLTNFLCGINSNNQNFKNESNYNFRNKRSTSDDYTNRQSIELYIVNDNTRYRTYNNDENKLFQNTKAIVNMANAIYQSVGVYVILVGSEIFTDGNKFEISKNKDTTLTNFQNYRQSHITQYNDNAFLISGICFDNNVIGVASLFTMCSFQKSSGIICADTPDADHIGKTLAHEIGHNLGLVHDIDSCSCADNRGCVMNSYNVNSMIFSSCSEKDLRSFLPTFNLCLLNQPDTIFQKLSICGNGFIENNEACDCGNLPSKLCNQMCCNNQTCQLIAPAQCSQGSCCNLQTCQYLSTKTVCRSKVDSFCDFDEFCLGDSNTCPPDSYKHDGTNCSSSSGLGYCVNGVCGNQDIQCKLLWGGKAINAPFQCYRSANVLGSISGYCNINWALSLTYNKCSTENVECGLLHCDKKGESDLKYYTHYSYQSYISINNILCNSVTFDYGLHATHPGMVPNGAPCGNKSINMCYNQKCVATSQILASCPICPNGTICNNNGKCQCDEMLAKCTETANSDVGLIVGLIFFFILIIIVIVLIVLFRDRLHKTIQYLCLKISSQKRIQNNNIATISTGNISSHQMNRSFVLPQSSLSQNEQIGVQTANTFESSTLEKHNCSNDSFYDIIEFPIVNKKPPTVPTNKPKLLYTNNNTTMNKPKLPQVALFETSNAIIPVPKINAFGNNLDEHLSEYDKNTNKQNYKPPVPSKKPYIKK